jgi:tryptophanyl-tRNA synthetase
MGGTSEKPVLLSGIQTSGHLMLGNYIGAIRNWANLQKEYDCIFLVADLHTLNLRQDPAKLREHSYEVIALYLACGLDAEKNILVLQSHVPQHAQLATVLACYTYYGELNRMTQFKDKSKTQADNINAGLFTYPVLMASDILLYDTQLVPVGEDQKQHLEITREIATRFNNAYDKPIFKVPELFNPPVGARIMALQDPSKKMSKSDDNESNYIGLLDDADLVNKKIMRAVTDSDANIRFDDSKPGVSNLLSILSSVSGTSIPTLENEFIGQGYGHAEAVVELLSGIQKRYHDIIQDKQSIHAILKKGAMAARSRAQKKINTVYEAVGLIVDETNITNLY